VGSHATKGRDQIFCHPGSIVPDRKWKRANLVDGVALGCGLTFADSAVIREERHKRLQTSAYTRSLSDENGRPFSFGPLKFGDGRADVTHGCGECGAQQTRATRPRLVA
jgi:hypothetical protein